MYPMHARISINTVFTTAVCSVETPLRDLEELVMKYRIRRREGNPFRRETPAYVFGQRKGETCPRPWGAGLLVTAIG